MDISHLHYRTEPASKPIQTILSEILRILTEQNGIKCDLEIIAGHFHFHPKYLAKQFKLHTGQSWKAFKLNLKMMHAQSLLRETDWGIEIISAQLGYVNKSAFIRFFRSHTGQNPTDFRRNARNAKKLRLPTDHSALAESVSGVETLCKTTTPEMATPDGLIHPTYLIRMAIQTAYQCVAPGHTHPNSYNKTEEIHRIDLIRSVHIGEQIITQGSIVQVAASVLVRVDLSARQPEKNVQHPVGTVWLSIAHMTNALQSCAVSGLQRPHSARANHNHAEITRWITEDTPTFTLSDPALITEWTHLNNGKPNKRFPSETRVIEIDYFTPAPKSNQICMPEDDIVGWMINTSYTCMRQFTQSAAVKLAAITHLTFKNAIRGHAVITVTAEVVFTGQRSVDIRVRMTTAPNPRPSVEGYFTFVCDKTCNAVEIPGLILDDPVNFADFIDGIRRKHIFNKISARPVNT